MAREEQIETACRWLASVGGSATPGDIGAALGLGNRQRQSEVINALRAGGLVEGPKQRVTLTAAGWARFGVAEPVGAGRALDAAVGGWPYAHQAYIRLMVSATIARVHLGEARPSGHLGFMAIGETGTGKSSPVEYVVCSLLGLDVGEVVREVPAETPGGIRGRHRDSGDGYQLVTTTSPAPVVLFDEFDKAEEQVRRAVWPYFQGKTVVTIDGTAYDRPSTPVLACNPPRVRGSVPPRGDAARYSMLRPEYRRRSVVLDTGYMHGRRAQLDAAVRAAIANPAPGGRLSLDRLKPPATALDTRALAILDQVREVLTDAGNEEYDVPGLELATLGRARLLGSGDLALAAVATATDYLLVAETVPGRVARDWHVQLEVLRRVCVDGGEVDQFAALVAKARTEADQHRGRARVAVVAKEREDVELIAERAALAERLRLAAESIDGRRLAVLTDAQRADAKGVRAALLDIRDRVNESRSPARLAELDQLAGEPLRLVAGIARQVEGEKRRRVEETRYAAQEKRRAAHALTRARKVDQQRRRKLREHLADELDRVVTAAKPLERLYARTSTRSGEQPFRVLRDLRIEGRALLTYEPPAIERGGGFLDKVGRAMAGPTPGTWRAEGTDIVFHGTAHQCAALDQWGPNTRAVLGPVLRWLHDIEDDRRAQLGRNPRTGRPQIPRRRSAVRTTGPAAIPATRVAALPTGPAHVQDVLAAISPRPY
ncbi:MAG: hypothetical protein JWP40_3442 [Blastococcus sp.]|nr:hypothetical protein [Blastococcus sp.]